MGIPTAIHEQNAFPGITNKLLAKVVDQVMLTVKEALKFMDKRTFDYTVTGTSRKEQDKTKSREEAGEELGFDDRFAYFHFGGSLGAGCINETMAEAIKWHVGKGLKIKHIHGYGKMGRDTFTDIMEENNIPLKSERLRITEYINDMDTCLAAADLVICRSGASTLAELEAAGKRLYLFLHPSLRAIISITTQWCSAMQVLL